MFVDQFGQKKERPAKVTPPGGLEPPTFRLTAERASQLRHGGFVVKNDQLIILKFALLQ